MIPPNPQPWFRVVVLTTLVLVLTTLTLPALAHTDTQLSNWYDRWETEFGLQFDGRGADPFILESLWDEYLDMTTRHPCRRVIDTWTQDCVQPVTHSDSPAPSTRGMGSNVEQWRPLVAVYFPANQVDRALCIMARESGGNPNAKNPLSSASGLFQHLASYWSERSSKAGWGGSSIWDPTANTAVAAWLWSIDGWSHWSPYNKGYCR